MADTSANQTTSSPDCVIYAKSAGRGRFHWGWHTADHSRQSRTVFAYFYDCLQDARRHGYHVDPAHVVAQLRASRLTIRIVPQAVEQHALSGQTPTAVD